MLTNLILGIIVTAGMLYGLYLMRGIDNFMDEEKKLQKKDRKKEYAVIFGRAAERKKLQDGLKKQESDRFIWRAFILIKIGRR